MSATAPETDLALFLEKASAIARSVGVGQLIAESQALEIVNDASFESAGSLRSALKGAQKRAEDEFEKVKKPLREAKAAFDQMEHRVVDPIKGAVSSLDERTTAFREEKRREADRLRRLEEEAARKAEEDRRLAEAAAAVDAGASEEEALAPLDEPVAPVLAPAAPVLPKVAGQSFVKTYSAEVFDKRALDRHVAAHPEDSNLTLPNMPALNQRAKAGAGFLSIPGVRVLSRDVVRGRSA